MSNTTYLTKTEYLNRRADWRASYATLSTAIRKTKAEIKEAQRAGAGHGSLAYKLERQKREATAAISELGALKALAQASYLADRDKQAQAA